MKILFFGMSPSLADWQHRPFAKTSELGARSGDNLDDREGVVAQESPGWPGDSYRRLQRVVLEYRIFPESIVERILAREPLEVGDTVGLCYRLLPGIRLFMASRVIDVFDLQVGQFWKSGFTYRTLQGHAAIGEETFTLSKNLETGTITFSLKAWSRPGHWLMRWGYPYARWCQRHAGRSALKRMTIVK
jgi:uncharacterized protein (UPF0548 family)